MKDEMERFKEILNVLKESDLKSGINPKKLVSILEKLGPTFIKIGQILSTRVDLLPDSYIKELGKLRSNVTPLEFNEVEKILKKEYKNPHEYFSYINKIPTGSASIAQVHKATMKNGEKVVLKIKRPLIDEELECDILLLKRAVNTLHLNTFIKIIDLNEVLDQLYKTTKEETNFEVEVKHLEKFIENNSSVSYISSPKVYENLCTKNVIVMEYIEGIKINDTESLINNGYDLKLIAKKLAENYIKQALDDGFFHADPHPDNILISDDKIVFIDLGMMGTLSNKNKSLLKRCIGAIVVEDYQEVSRILVDMSTKNGEVDYLKLRNDIKSILTEFGDSNLENIKTSKFITDMFKMLQSNHLILDYDVTMLIRGIGIIEGVLEKLDSKISLIQVLKDRYSSEMIGNLLNSDSIKRRGQKILKSTHDITAIPSEVLNLVSSINNGEAKFKFEFSDSSNQVDKIESLVHEIVVGFIDGCLIIGATFVNDEQVKAIFIIAIMILSGFLIFKMLFDHKHKGY